MHLSLDHKESGKKIKSTSALEHIYEIITLYICMLVPREREGEREWQFKENSVYVYIYCMCVCVLYVKREKWDSYD